MWEVLILDGFDKVQQFADDIIAVIRKSRWSLFSPHDRIGRFFFGKEYWNRFDTLIRPAVDLFVKGKGQRSGCSVIPCPSGEHFHASPYADPADSIVVAT